VPSDYELVVCGQPVQPLAQVTVAHLDDTMTLFADKVMMVLVAAEPKAELASTV
jgi:hypothetical protein